MLRHLSRSTAVQLRVPMGIWDLEEVGAGLGTGLFRLVPHEVAQDPGNGWWWLLQPSLLSHLRNSCQVAGGGGVWWFLNGELVGDRANSHLACSFPLEFSSGSPPTLQLFCGCALSGHCFMSVKSHNNKQQLGLGVLFHLHWPTLGVFGVSLPFLIFLLLHEHRQRLNFLFFGSRLQAFIEIHARSLLSPEVPTKSVSRVFASVQNFTISPNLPINDIFKFSHWF